MATLPPLPVSVVIVSFNTCELLRRCLLSVADCADVIVVDNASRDGSAAMVSREFPSVVLIENDVNVGFGRACNQGIASATSPLVLLLNSDAFALPGAVETLVRCFDDPTVRGAGGRFPHPSAAGPLTLWRVLCEQLWLERIFPSSQLLNGYWLNRWLPNDQPTEVFQVMGACLMMRRGTLFDERFKLYVEDTDLCRRLGRVVFEPRAKFGHELGGSSRQERWRSVALYNAGKELYFRIHAGWWAWFLCLLLNRLGALLRLPLKPRMFLPVLFAPISGPGLA